METFAQVLFNQEMWYKTLFILIIFLIGRIVLRFIVRKAVLLTRRNSNMTQTALEGKIGTISSLFQGIGDIVVFLIIFLMILDIFGIDIRPLLAGAGILGIAVGFGSQALIKDVISGLFILMEEQYNVGDRIKIGNTEGRVVRFSPRTTVLKDDEDNLVYVPNGSIAQVVNMKKKTPAEPKK